MSSKVKVVIAIKSANLSFCAAITGHGVQRTDRPKYMIQKCKVSSTKVEKYFLIL